MNECPVCHKQFKRLDLHMGVHPKQPAKALKLQVRKLKDVKIVQPLHISEIKEHVGQNTPLTLKAAVDDDSWLRSIHALPFNKHKMVMGKWPIIIVVAIILVIVGLYFAGVIPGGK
jgi:hypothetical protein